MKLYRGTNTRFSVGGLVGSKSIGIALPHVCFSHFVLHFVCQGLLRNRESFGKFRLSNIAPQKTCIITSARITSKKNLSVSMESNPLKCTTTIFVQEWHNKSIQIQKWQAIWKKIVLKDSYPSLQEAALMTHYTSIVPRLYGKPILLARLVCLGLDTQTDCVWWFLTLWSHNPSSN